MMEQRKKGAILGLAVGDALGVPVEYISRNTLSKNPVTGMIGYGTHRQPAGTWSDDTSMTLCLLHSLKHGLDCDDIMQHFVDWLQSQKFTPHNAVFDIGNATLRAIHTYMTGVPCTECGGSSEYDNGNGSLMRILPLSFYIYEKYGSKCEIETIIRLTHQVSSLTHNHIRTKIACSMYILTALAILDGLPLPEAIDSGIKRACAYYENKGEAQLSHYRLLTEHSIDIFAATPESEIRSTGYVVDTLLAAFWCLLNTSDYRSCVLKAVNLGDDTDSVGAVTGGLAGLYYGLESIPSEWIDQLAKKEEILKLCEDD